MTPGGELLAELALGASVGFTIGLTGVGGGVLIVPALSLVLGLPATAAVGTASAYICLTNILASVQHVRAGNVDFPLAHRFLVGALPGNVLACLGVAWAKRAATAGSGLAALQSHLRMFIVGVMAVSVLLLLADLTGGLRRGDDASGQRPAPPLPLLLALGALVGAVLGATSVGGGAIMVPLLMLACGLPARATVGTSSYLALILTGSTTLLSAGRGDVQWLAAALLATGSLAGVWTGVRLGGRLPERPLRLAVVLLLLAAIAGMLVA